MAVRAHPRRRSPAAGIASCVDCVRLLAPRQPTTSRSSSATQIRAVLRTRLCDTVWPAQVHSLHHRTQQRTPAATAASSQRTPPMQSRLLSAAQASAGYVVCFHRERFTPLDRTARRKRTERFQSTNKGKLCIARHQRYSSFPAQRERKREAVRTINTGLAKQDPNERRRLLSRSVPKRQHRPRDALATMLELLSSAALASRSDAPKRIGALQGDRHGGFRRPSFLRS